MAKLDLNLAWEILNEVCFEGELTRPRIYAYHTLIETPSYKNERSYLMGAYQHGYCKDRNEILIWSKQAPQDILETLFHEMVHQYFHEVMDEHANGHGKQYNELYWGGIEKLCQYIKRKAGNNGDSTARYIKGRGLRRKQKLKVVRRMPMDTGRNQSESQEDVDEGTGCL